MRSSLRTIDRCKRALSTFRILCGPSRTVVEPSAKGQLRVVGLVKWDLSVSVAFTTTVCLIATWYNLLSSFGAFSFWLGALFAYSLAYLQVSLTTLRVLDRTSWDPVEKQHTLESRRLDPPSTSSSPNGPAKVGKGKRSIVRAAYDSDLVEQESVS